jgi:hypothetical protein
MMLPVEVLGPVDCRAMREWIQRIPLEKWPPQSFTELMPAMVNNLNWFGFGDYAIPLANGLIKDHFPHGSAYQYMLSVVMPGHNIPPHVDLQPNEWVTRVHVPLVSNEKSRFIVEGIPHVLSPGTAYTVDTTREHAVANDGLTPRIHFMFDIRKG